METSNEQKDRMAEAKTMPPLKKNKLHNLRWLISAILVIIALAQLDLTQLHKTLHSIPLWFLLVSCINFIILQMIVTIRWYLLLPNFSLKVLFKLNAIGFFASFTFPSSISSDIAKIIVARGANITTAQFAASVLVDRMLGFISLFMLLLLLLPFARLEHFVSFGSEWLSFITVSAAVAIVAWIGMAFFRQRVDRWRVRRFLVEIKSAMKNYRQSPWRFSASFGLSVFYQLATALSYLLVNIVMDINVSFADYFVCLAVLQLASLLPLSVAGVGIKEVSFIGLLGLLGVSSEKSYAIVLLGYPITIVYAAVGFGLLIQSRRKLTSKKVA